MKFTEGLWFKRSGLSVHTVKQLWEYRITENSVHAFVLCHCVETPDDYTAGTALELEFTAPAKDVIGVRAVHFKGDYEADPAFDLNTQEVPVEITDLEETIEMRNGRMKVIIRKGKAFSFAFYFDGRYLTGSDNGSLAYVADADYEADKIDDVNHRTLMKPYLKKTFLRERLNLGIGEAIYGLGERFMPLVRNGQTMDVWNRDGGSGGNQAYKCIPFYLSNRGYGVLVNTPDYVKFEIGTESVRHVQFSVEDEKMSYLVIGGAQPKEVLSKYTALTGRTPVPPAWTFGLWLSTSWIPNSTEQTALDAIDKMKACGIPLSVYHFDARWMEDFHDCDFVWSKRFGDARHMIEEIHKRGVKVCVWINPYVSQISRLFDEGMRGGYFLKTKEGRVWQTDMWMCGTAYVDFTNPEAVKWYTGRLGEILDMGVDCIKTDFGERIPEDVVYFNGANPRKMHNYYAFLYNQAIYRLLVEKKGKEEAVVFARAATVGTQQFPINWGGDNQASYISMLESLRGGLSFCQSGFGYWCQDVTGFDGKATPDLYKRWVGFGMLCTHSRLHGHTSLRMPWCFDEESCEVLAHFTKLKCALMPYIYSEAVKVHTQGIPEMRAMMLEFPEDPTCEALEREYMLGDRLLIAPIFDESGSVTFYLPAGRWTDYQTGRVLEGEKWHTESYDYFGLPLMVRENSIVPVREDAQDVVYDYRRDVTLEVFELEDGASAQAEICRANETEGALVTVTRNGKEIRVRTEGLCGRYRVLLRGCLVENADVAVEESERGTYLLPEEGVSAFGCSLQ